MANEKIYTAKEAALAVIKKAEEVLSKSSLVKKDMLDDNIAQRRQGRAADYKKRGDETSHKIAIEGAKEAHKQQLSDLKAQPKPNLTKSAANVTPPDGVESVPGPESDPRGSNQQPGTVPPMAYGNGIHKLSHFMGHMTTKKKKKVVVP